MLLRKPKWNIQELFKKGRKLLDAGDLDGLRDYMGETAEELRAHAVTKRPELYSSKKQ